MSDETDAITFQVVKTLVGSSSRLLAKRHGAANVQENTVIMSCCSSRKLRDSLAHDGFLCVHEFSILPSRHHIRWLMPANASLMLSGLQMYAPFSLRARLLKAVIVGLAKLGWKGWSGAKIIVASKSPLPLQLLVTEITGEQKPKFAFSFGNLEALRMMTVQVMRSSGEVLGYMKLPLSLAASQAVRHEASMLNYLWEESPRLRNNIPRVFHSGEWDDGFLLFESSGPSRSGPLRFGKMHSEFLKQLEQVGTVQKSGSALVEDTAASWQKMEGRLSAEWQSLGREVLAQATALLDGAAFPCGVVHGDFAPWNTRQENGQLFVFDLYLTMWRSPRVWDVFRFHDRVSVLLNQTQVSYPRDLISNREKGLFLLYCLESVCDAKAHGGRYLDAKTEYHKNQLLRCLQQVRSRLVQEGVPLF